MQLREKGGIVHGMDGKDAALELLMLMESGDEAAFVERARSLAGDGRDLGADGRELLKLAVDRGSEAIATLFEPQRLYRVEPGGRSRGIVPEKQAHRRRESKREGDYGIGRHARGPVECIGDHMSANHPDADADDSADQAQYHRLDQKLTKHVATASTDRLPQSDLACPLRDRYQHDVHDADAADNERHGRNRREEALHGRGRLSDRLRNLGGTSQVEVVVDAGAEVVALAQQGRDVSLSLIDDDPQFWFPYTSCTRVSACGVTLVTVVTWSRMPSKSASVRVFVPNAPVCTPLRFTPPASIQIMLTPMFVIACSMRADAPSPIAMTQMTAPTPMMMPSIVSSQLVLPQGFQRDVMDHQHVHIPPQGTDRT